MYTFDGEYSNEITTPDYKFHIGLFQYENLVCRVGGYKTDDAYPDPVVCYDPNQETWVVNGYLSEARLFPGVAATRTGTYVFGGRNQEGDRTNSTVFFNHKSKTWYYISGAFNVGAYPQAVTFNF